MQHTAHYRRLMILALIGLLILTACAPDNLDITPSPTATLEPSPTPSPTAEPEGFEAEVEQNEAIIEALMELLPGTIPAGAAEWKRNYARGTDGIEPLRGLTNGVGRRMYFAEQTGGQISINFAVFDTPEDAAVEYERIKGIRAVLNTGDANDTFPEPNLFGISNQGSNAIFQIDNYFIEVFIEISSSTQDNPLVAMSRQALRFFEDNRDTFETLD